MAIAFPKGQPVALPVKFPSSPLEAHGKTYVEIEHVYMGLKKYSETDADDAYLQKLSDVDDGVTVEELDHRFIMNVDGPDTENMKPGLYELIIAIKVVGIPSRLEFKLSDGTVEITPDKSRG